MFGCSLFARFSVSTVVVEPPPPFPFPANEKGVFQQKSMGFTKYQKKLIAHSNILKKITMN